MTTSQVMTTDYSALRKAQGKNLVFRHFEIVIPDEYFGTPPTWDGRFDTVRRKKTGRVCVAVARPPKDSASCEFRAAVAFCSPLDPPNRRIGNDIATGRLFAQRPGRNFTFTVPENQTKDFDRIFSTALDYACNPNFIVAKNKQSQPYAPRWVHIALKAHHDFVVVS